MRGCPEMHVGIAGHLTLARGHELMHHHHQHGSLIYTERDEVEVYIISCPFASLYTRIGSNRGNTQSTIMCRIQNIHTPFASKTSTHLSHCFLAVDTPLPHAPQHRWAIAPKCIEQFRIVLSIFKVSDPTIQRDCPSMHRNLIQRKSWHTMLF